MHFNAGFVHIRGYSTIVGQLSRTQPNGGRDTFGDASTGTLDPGECHLVGELVDRLLALFDQANTGKIFDPLLHLGNFKGDRWAVLPSKQKLDLNGLAWTQLLGRPKLQVAFFERQREDFDGFSETEHC
jgi:hypothetical protein